MTENPLIFTEPVLVVSQKATAVEGADENAVHDRHGRRIGAVRQVRTSGGGFLSRVFSGGDRSTPHRLEIVDEDGQVLVGLISPGGAVKSELTVTDAQDGQIGRLALQEAVRQPRFTLESGGAVLGTIEKEGLFSRDWRLYDDAGTEIATVISSKEGLEQEIYAADDSTVVRTHRPLAEPLRSLALTAALGLERAMTQR